MLPQILQLLGFRKGDSMEACLDRLEGLSQESRNAIKDAYLQADSGGTPGKRFAREALRSWRSGRTLEALELYGRAIEHSPEDSTLLLNRAQLQVELGNVTEALSDFERARAGHPRLPERVFAMQEGLQSMSPAALEVFIRSRKGTA